MLALLKSSSVRFVLVLAAGVSLVQAKDSVYSKSTIVVYNKNFPGSAEIAAHYISQRGISKGNRVALDCSSKEVISRAEFRESIERPLRKLFTEKEWWTVQNNAGRPKVVENKMRVLVLIHGMPLKIKDTSPEPRPTNAAKMQTDAASVDSELALLGQFNERLPGWLPNPYFRQEKSFGDAGFSNLMLVGRVDGPKVVDCRRMINDASEIERTGLWGFAYVDLAKKTNGGYKQGEDWLNNVVTQCERDGIPTIVDANNSSFPSHYPMDEAALYFGWYARNANGPFEDPNFKLKKGAIAAHIHSFSALTLRSETDEWTGPLVHHGAAGTLGNVYEPFLTGTTHLDVFLQRLLEGYTLAEAAYMATPYLSWMSVVVGDPLYRPYDGFRTYEPQFYRNDEALHYKTYHVATKLWDANPPEYLRKLEAATSNHKTGFYHEAQAGRLRTAGSRNGAIGLLRKAKDKYLRAEDQFRVDLQIADMERLRNNKPRAKEMLRAMEASAEYKALPRYKSVKALLNQLDPPGPAGS